MDEKRIFLVEEEILEILEEEMPLENLACFYQKEMFVLSKKPLSSKEKRQKENASCFHVQAFLDAKEDLPSLLSKTYYSNNKGVLLLTTSKQRVYEAQFLGIDSCFFDTGINDFCSLFATMEVKEAKQFLKTFDKK